MIRPRSSELLMLCIKQVAAPCMRLRDGISFAERSMCRRVSRFKVPSLCAFAHWYSR